MRNVGTGIAPGILKVSLEGLEGPEYPLNKNRRHHMKKTLNPKTHGMLDYGLAIMFLIAPAIFGFSEVAATTSYVIGVLYVGTSLLTRYPLGAIKLIPFPVHGVLESVMAAAWIILPWALGFAGDAAARNFFIIAGAGLLVVALLTDYKATQGAHSMRERSV